MPLMSEDKEEKLVHVTVDYTSIPCSGLGGDSKTCMDISEPHKRCAWYFECHRHDIEETEELMKLNTDEKDEELGKIDRDGFMRFGPTRCTNCG